MSAIDVVTKPDSTRILDAHRDELDWREASALHVGIAVLADQGYAVADELHRLAWSVSGQVAARRLELREQRRAVDVAHQEILDYLAEQHLGGDR